MVFVISVKHSLFEFELRSLEGIVRIGGPLNVEILEEAYEVGVFPWPHDDKLLWFFPPGRGVITKESYRIPKSVQKELKKNHYRFSINRAFDEVITQCQKVPRPGQSGTWITPEMREAYTDFFKKGHVLSFECWDGEKLLGGMYGVLMKNRFSAESMFFQVSGASKMTLAFAFDYLFQLSLKWVDIQMVTPVTELFGGFYITDEEFWEWIHGK